jgi:predicted nucleic acid-binding protein
VDAFDADVLIYAANPHHPLGAVVLANLPPLDNGRPTGIGSVLLLAEVLTKPTRSGDTDEILALAIILRRLDWRPVDRATAELAVTLGPAYGLRAADAIHLACAVNAGADRFITNNKKDLPESIAEIDITYPEDLSLDFATKPIV